MLRLKLLRLAIVPTLMVSAISAHADAGSDFVTAFAAAVNTKNRSAWENFLSPGSRACLNGPGREMLDHVFAQDTRRQVAADSKVWVTPIGPKDVLLSEDMLAYADRPTHYFQIDLGPSGRSTASLVRYGRLEQGRWQYVTGCPTAAGLAAAKVAARERASAEAEARKRLKTLPPAVIAEARRLLGEGQTIAAGRIIAKETGSDLQTAVGMARVLEREQ